MCVPSYNYDQLRNLFEILYFAKNNFLPIPIKGTLEASDVLARIPFGVRTFASQNLVHFYILYHSTTLQTPKT